jgi:DNA polymerase III alpha subunit (gram-positive type)
MSATYIAVDTETGGIGSDVSLLTAYIAVLDKQMNIIDELDLAVKPDSGIYNVTAEALNINKINLIEHDAKAITLGKAGELFREFLMKHSPNGSIKLLPLGHNVAFDMDKLYQHVLNKKEAQKYISYRVLDTGSTGNFLKAAGLIPEAISGGLGTYAEYYKVQKREQHIAKNDVLLTIDVMKAMMKQIS